MPDLPVRRFPEDALDSEVAEEWGHVTDDPDVLGVTATKWRAATSWSWQVFVAAAEFVREEPLESELRAEIASAISSVRGAIDVAEEDREVWLVDGNPSGADLVRAVARTLDAHRERIRAHVEGQPSDGAEGGAPLGASEGAIVRATMTVFRKMGVGDHIAVYLDVTPSPPAAELPEWKAQLPRAFYGTARGTLTVGILLPLGALMEAARELRAALTRLHADSGRVLVFERTQRPVDPDLAAEQAVLDAVVGDTN